MTFDQNRIVEAPADGLGIDRTPQKVEIPNINIAIDEVNVLELADLGVKMQAVEDKMFVLVDAFKTGYECRECKGKGRVASKVVDGASHTCEACDGKGVIKGGLHVADISKSMPSTGVIVSMGPNTEYMKIKNTIEYYPTPTDGYITALKKELNACLLRPGARVIFGVHTGTKIPLKGGIIILCMREKEPLGVVYGSKGDDILEIES